MRGPGFNPRGPDHTKDDMKMEPVAAKGYLSFCLQSKNLMAVNMKCFSLFIKVNSLWRYFDSHRAIALEESKSEY